MLVQIAKHITGHQYSVDHMDGSSLLDEVLVYQKDTT